ncbi:MAG: rod shape-determining protein MreC, partial [Atopobiaceae bacterium]|nr:rod shape-determining protein MreC [Atopobiaceae bacterium]
DIVVTSGLGGVFPKGLMLGTVESVERSSGSLYYDITVRAPSSPGLQEEVLIITALSEDQQATAEDIAAAEALSQGTDAEGADASSAEAAPSDESSDEGDGA